MRAALLTIAALVLSVPPRAAAADAFQWHGSIGPGHSIEIKGVNGDIRAEPSGSNEVEVVAEKRRMRDAPESVRIDVVPHDGDVTVCAVYPTREIGRAHGCTPVTV